MRLVLSFVAVLSLTFATAACESVSHDNIDKWGHTQKGPGKLRDALKSNDHSPALRAHAAEVLIDLGNYPEVREILEGLKEETRYKIMTELATRLWEMARINDAMAIPNNRQTTAKDVLYYAMDMADQATRDKMADYLVEWYVGGHYEGRATAGSVSGAMAIRKVGTRASSRLLTAAKAIVARPPDAEGRRLQVGQETLRALALSASPEALLFLMELVDQPRGDEGLPKRVIGALYFAYVEPQGFEPVPGTALVPIANKLEAIFYKSGLSATMRNDAAALLATMGAEACIPVFTRMTRSPSDGSKYLWMGAQQGIRCSGVQGIEAITEAIPSQAQHERGLLSKYLWDEILKQSDKKKIATAAVALLQSQSWVSRVTGIELLGSLGKTADVAENIKLIRALSNDSTRLKNWWGKQEDVPKTERKSPPTVGQVATNVAKSLETLALEAEGK